MVIGLASELSNSKFEMVNRSRVYERLYWKGGSVQCFMNHLYKTHHAKARQVLINMYQKDEIKICVDQSSFVGIEDIPKASMYLLEGRSCGKVVVKL